MWNNLKDETCKAISSRETSILWDIWHITRIEDLVSNILIGNKDTVFNDAVQKKLNIGIKDTGNSLSCSEITELNSRINIRELREYRIKQNGGVTDHPQSIWLLDFWGRKNVLGLIMMPITRHQIVHMKDCFRIKQKFNK